MRKRNKIVSVWGGVFQDVYVQRIYSLYKRQRKGLRQDIETPYVLGVLITGSIQTWSTVLVNRCDTEECVEARLKSFKDRVKLKKHSIGFMFVYVLCKKEKYYETNVESTIFKRLFPKVPLVGCFDYGELGKTTIMDEVKEESEFFILVFLMKI